MIFFICKQNDTFKYKGAILLNHYEIQEDSPTNTNRPWSFCLRLEKRSDNDDRGDIFKLYARNKDNLLSWRHAINEALNHTSPIGAQEKGHEFGMHNYREPTQCNLCERLLRGAFYQGYKCKNCQMNLHLECVNSSRKPYCGQELETSQNFTTVRAIADFPPSAHSLPSDSHNYLHFRKDDLIQLTERLSSDWSRGIFQGRIGLFQQKYVRTVSSY